MMMLLLVLVVIRMMKTTDNISGWKGIGVLVVQYLHKYCQSMPLFGSWKATTLPLDTGL